MDLLAECAIGLAVLPLAITRLAETTGPHHAFDLPRFGLASAGLFGLVFSLVRGSEHGWASVGVAGPLMGLPEMEESVQVK